LFESAASISAYIEREMRSKFAALRCVRAKLMLRACDAVGGCDRREREESERYANLRVCAYLELGYLPRALDGMMDRRP
jgi:hypothetical protein